jgi:magnesium chelatase subunit D
VNPADWDGGVDEALAVFAADPEAGLVLTGDAWGCEQAFAAIARRLQGRWRVVRVGPADTPESLAAVEVTGTGRLVRAAAWGELDPASAALLRRAPALAVVGSVPPALASRCALVVNVQVPQRAAATILDGERPWLPDGPAGPAAGALLSAEEAARLATAMARDFGLADHELEYRAARAALAASRLGLDPASVLARWVFGPRAVPVEPPSPPPAADRPQELSEGDRASEGAGDAGETVLPPVDAPPPERGAWPRRRARRQLPGRHGPPAPDRARGRPGRTRPWNRGARPDVPATLAFALPRMALRGWRPGEPPRLWPSDLRQRERRRRAGVLQVIVIDASGSMAREAIRRAKGAAIATLRGAYVDRRTVAVVVARGRSAYLDVPPTRSTGRVAASLRRLPAGGGTPLASAYLLAWRLARRAERAAVEVLVFTDGRPNVPLEPGGDPAEDARRALRVLETAAARVRVETVRRGVQTARES